MREPKTTNIVFINNIDRSIPIGPHMARNLKQMLNVPAHLAIAKITHNGLTHYEDDDSVDIKSHDHFISHARAGGSM